MREMKRRGFSLYCKNMGDLTRGNTSFANVEPHNFVKDQDQDPSLLFLLHYGF